jgi:hypothetical protein
MGLLNKIPLIGSFFDSPEQADLQNSMQQASGTYSALRPQMAQAVQNAKANQLGAYRGMENLLAQKYGAGVLPQTGNTDPMGPNMMSTGQVIVPPAERQGSVGGDVGAGALHGAVVGGAGGAMVGGYGAPIGAAVGGVAGGLLGAANYYSKSPYTKGYINNVGFQPYNVPGRR